MLLVGSTTGTLTGPQITRNVRLIIFSNKLRAFFFNILQDPTYTKVKILTMVCPAIALAMILAIRFINVMENRRRDALPAAAQSHVQNSEFLDLTDGENHEFRYSMVCVNAPQT